MSTHVAPTERRTGHLPSLPTGVVRVDLPEPRSVGFHHLVVDALVHRDDGGPVHWIDARNNASTYVLTDLVPHERALAQVRVARAFTAHQHYALVSALPRRVTDDADLLVLPCLGSLYADDDLRAGEDDLLLSGTMDVLVALARRYDLTVLLSTGSVPPALHDRIAAAANATIQCRQTREGFRYVARDFETEIYAGPGYR
ncbi:MAG: hypothetical protein R3324_01440, partial [Halobacteriales archaeon]|nr:hypothetical protein [Halobacteriales archaeon]